MKKTDRPVIKAVTKSHIKRLIKNFGLQSYMFDTSLFSLEWEGLEYRFKIMDGRLLLQSVAVCMGVFPASLKTAKNSKKRGPIV